MKFFPQAQMQSPPDMCTHALSILPKEKGESKGMGKFVSVKFSSVIHLTVDNYYLRGFGLISISVSLRQVFPWGKKKLHKRLYALPGILAYSSSAPHSAYSWRFCALPAPRLCAWLYPSFCSSSH